MANVIQQYTCFVLFVVHVQLPLFTNILELVVVKHLNKKRQTNKQTNKHTKQTHFGCYTKTGSNFKPRQLRKQLEAVVRSRSTSPGRSPMVSRRSQDTLMPSTPVQTPRMKAASNGAKSQVSVQRTMLSPKSPRNMVKPRWEIEPSTLVSHAEAPADTEAFLKYLDVFQAQARSLIQSQN